MSKDAPAVGGSTGTVSEAGGARARLARLVRDLPACAGWSELPTPVERAAWLDAGGHQVWIKRDDLSSTVYGGGKVRKLEWILANPPHAGPRPVLSIGGVGSHHLVALAAFLERQGRTLQALTFEQTPTPHVLRNLAMMASAGVQFWHVRTRAGLPLAWLDAHVWRQPPVLGRYLTPGASTAVGMLGFVAAGLELADQIVAGLLPPPSTIYLAVGTAGTAAGLAVGLALSGVSTHLRLVSSVEPMAFNRVMFGLKLGELGDELVRRGVRRPGGVAGWLRDVGVSWSIDHAQVGGGYGVPTPAATEAIQVCDGEGVHLEPTYTGKVVAALRGDLGGGARFRPRPGPVLFWNTHGGTDLTPWIVEDWLDWLPPSLARWARDAGGANLLASPS